MTETRQAEPEAVGEREPAAEQLDQLRFLHRVARMATTARTWEELLETVVDETRDALLRRGLARSPASAPAPASGIVAG